ncbi:Alpha/Beta hydrolase protein [Endogone sp. FLAS-F59071]|nr:Alpha/Beta hydrolase protein [Endogone sp. FLAS-F59071]|eukprot:RUS21862.1 Alpha/Beta hydrolase protein [Endogone sp. FLAS-F59071]
MGPIHLNEDLNFTFNPHSWANDYSMLFIDQPVGTGYSYVEPPVPVVLPHGHPTSPPSSIPQRQSPLLHVQTDEPDMKLNAGDSGIGLLDGYFGQMPIIKDDSVGGKAEDPDYSHGYVINQRGVTKDLLRFLDAFYERYPDQEERDLYIMGECRCFRVCVDVESPTLASMFRPSHTASTNETNLLEKV